MDDRTRIQIDRPYHLADPTQPLRKIAPPADHKKLRNSPARRRQARVEAYREVREIAWTLFAVVCCLTLTVTFGITVAMVADRLTWK